MSQNPILGAAALSFPWQTKDPFLLCVHHVDLYPRGNEALGPVASLEGRDMGQDFAGKDGWRMYHGHVVPGFPQHPHRGFETVTFVRDGLIDHSDSLGATARFGSGDVQWLTAGGGIVHSEMFPLVAADKPNRLELFQIWVNLPGKSKLAPPYFTMFWDKNVPRHRPAEGVEITLIAGELAGATPPAPPPDSWAANPEADLAIWLITLEPGASWTLPPARGATTVRTLYFFKGAKIAIADHALEQHAAIDVAPDQPVEIGALEGPVEVLVMQGKPIGEPVAQYGPFVMNTRAELQTAFDDYRRTQFGGWPFPADDPVHPRERGRFARHADGRVEDAPA
jgi:redox-sensitive bicupin YhaK (pirin superfamily)